MFEILILVGCLLYIPVSWQLQKGTFLEFSWRKKSFAGLILGKEIFVLIIPGILLYTFGIYKNYAYFYVTDESVREATIYALYALFLFSVSISCICKFFYRNKFLLVKQNLPLTGRDLALFLQLYKIATGLIFLVLAIFFAVGMRHALLSNIFLGTALMDVRLQNRYASGVPTVVMSFFRFLFIFSGILFGLIYKNISWAKRFFGICVILFAVTFFGDKAPIFSVFVLSILANLSTREIFSLKKIIKYSVIMGAISLTVLYGVSYVQFGEIDPLSFFEFLLFRAGLGQISGLYEQFALKIQDFNYVWHSVPFANLLLDYPVFNKDLMMLTWGANAAADESGVANSLFVGEAYAIGGYALVIFSPVIVAINYCVAIVLLGHFFKSFFGFSMSGVRLVLQLLIPSIFVLTGDLAGLVFGKSLAITLIFLLVLWGVRKMFYRRRFAIRASA